MTESNFKLPNNSFSIYQVKDGEEYHLLRFSSLESQMTDAMDFRKQMHAETIKLYDQIFDTQESIIHQLRQDGFTLLPSKDPQRLTVQNASMRTSEFCLGFGDHCCWICGCNTRNLDSLISRSSYDLVYSGQIPESRIKLPDQFLEDLFHQFNTTYADGYTGRSMSVSDVVVLNSNNTLEAYYVEPFGFQKVPDFLSLESPLKNAEMSIEDDYDMIDGIINNGEKKSIREELKEYRTMIEAYVHPFPKGKSNDQPDLEH